MGSARRVKPAPQKGRRVRMPNKLWALTLPLAWIGVLACSVLIVRLIALLSGETTSILSATDSALGRTVQSAVRKLVCIWTGSIPARLKFPHVAVEGQLLVHVLRDGRVKVLALVVW